MGIKDTPASAGAPSTPPFFFNWDRGDAALNLQKAILESYEHASHVWLERLQSEIALWSDMANKLSATKTLPQALETCSKCVSQRMQMAADDGRKIFDEAQNVTQKIARSLGNGGSAGST
jgi:hypothetical protein